MDHRRRQIGRDAEGPEAAAEYILHGLRHEAYYKSRVLFLAYLRDPVAMLVAENLGAVKSRGLIIQDRLLPRLETIQVARGLNHFPVKYTNRVALGIMKLLVYQQQFIGDLRSNYDKAERYILHNEDVGAYPRSFRRNVSQFQTRRQNTEAILNGFYNRLELKRHTTPWIVTSTAYISGRMWFDAARTFVTDWALEERCE